MCVLMVGVPAVLNPNIDDFSSTEAGRMDP